MVCKKCESKTSKVATADPSRPGSSSRVIGENKLLTARSRATPYAKPGGLKSKVNTYGNKCIECKKTCQQNNATRCHRCAYKKGLCAICGTTVLDVSRYKQSVK